MRPGYRSRVIQMMLPLRRDIREYAACWARVLSFLLPGLGHVFVGAVSFGLLYFTAWSASVLAMLRHLDDDFMFYLATAAVVWLLSLGHIHLQTKGQ